MTPAAPLQRCLCLCAIAALAFAPASCQMPELSKVTALSSVDKPWDVAVTPQGDLLYSEICRGFSIILRDGDSYSDPILLFGKPELEPALAAADFMCEGQSGALGVELDPDFPTNRYIYFFMTSSDGGGVPFRSTSNHIVRLKLSEDKRGVSDRTDIVDDMYFKIEGTNNGDAGAHSGGRLRFGPDGLLYATTGDNHNATLPQDLNALGGKVLRVTRDGDPPSEGNSMPAGADPRIFAYGFRNVQVRRAHCLLIVTAAACGASADDIKRATRRARVRTRSCWCTCMPGRGLHSCTTHHK
jgi:aldose sugar dehydrogenase